MHQRIYQSQNGIYGAPRIKIALELEYNIIISQKKIWRYMTLLSLKSFVRLKKKHKKPKEEKNTKNGFANVVERKWNLYAKNQLFVTDISYFHTEIKNLLI